MIDLDLLPAILASYMRAFRLLVLLNAFVFKFLLYIR